MKMICGVLSALLLGGTISCSGATEPPAVTTVSITPNTPSLASGASVQLQATALSEQGKALSGKTVLWSSTNPQVASVSQTGMVTAGNVLAANSEMVIISATIDGVSGSVTISIQPVPVASVTVTSPKTIIAQTDTVRVIADIKGPSGQALTGRTVEWSVEDTTFASISSSGLVTVKKSAGVFQVRGKVGAISGTVILTASCFARTVTLGTAVSGVVDNTDCPSASNGLFFDAFRFTLSQSGFVRHTSTLSASTSATLGASVVQDSSLRHFYYDYSTGGSGVPSEAILYGRGTYRTALRSETVGVPIPYTYRVDATSTTVSTCTEHPVVVGIELIIDRNLNTCQLNGNRYHHYYTVLLFAGQTITIDAMSDFIDPYMCIGATGAGAWTTCNDDTSSGWVVSTNSRIVFAAATSGWYDFVVTTSAADNTTGVYRLKATSSPALLMADAVQLMQRPKLGVEPKNRPIPQSKQVR